MQNTNPAGQGVNRQPAQTNTQSVIRLRISLQYGEKGSINYLLTPESADHWEQVLPQDCRTTMRRLFESPVTAWQLGNYPQLRGLVYTHIVQNPVDFRGGFVQITLFVDRRYQLAAKTIIDAMSKTEQMLFANKDRFRASIEGTDHAYKQQVQNGADTLLQELGKQLKPAYAGGVPQPAPASAATFYRVVTSSQQLEEILNFPEQAVFNKTPLITVVESMPNPASPTRPGFVPYDRTGACVEVRDHIVKIYEIISATNGKVYGVVREGTQQTINLQGMAGFLPRTLNIQPQAKTPEYSVVGTQIVVDEKKVRYYKEFTITVVEEGTLRPIPNATIDINGQKLRTNATGQFVGQFLATEQEKHIRISSPNHEPQETVLRLSQLPQTEKCSSQVVLKPRQNTIDVSINISGEVFAVKNINLSVTSPVYTALRSGYYKGYPVGKIGENKYQIQIPSQMSLAGSRNPEPEAKTFIQKYWLPIAAFLVGMLLAYLLASTMNSRGPIVTPSPSDNKEISTPKDTARQQNQQPADERYLDESIEDAEYYENYSYKYYKEGDSYVVNDRYYNSKYVREHASEYERHDSIYLKRKGQKDEWDINQLQSAKYIEFLIDLYEGNISTIVKKYDHDTSSNQLWGQIYDKLKKNVGDPTTKEIIQKKYKEVVSWEYGPIDLNKLKSNLGEF